MDQVNIWRLKPGTKITVKTLNHEYHLEVLEGSESVKIQGGNHFTDPESVYYWGATRGGIIRVGRIISECPMELIRKNGRIVITSKVQGIEIDGP